MSILPIFKRLPSTWPLQERWGSWCCWRAPDSHQLQLAWPTARNSSSFPIPALQGLEGMLKIFTAQNSSTNWRFVIISVGWQYAHLKCCVPHSDAAFQWETGSKISNKIKNTICKPALNPHLWNYCFWSVTCPYKQRQSELFKNQWFQWKLRMHFKISPITINRT